MSRITIMLAALLVACTAPGASTATPPAASPATATPLSATRVPAPDASLSTATPLSATRAPATIASTPTPAHPATAAPSASPGRTAPSPSAPVTPAPTRTVPALAGAVRVYESQLVVNSYDWERALVPTQPGDAVYPYPRLDPARVGPIKPRALRVIVLESAAARLSIAPELGGRILRWFDKTAGREVLYANKVLKPTAWGYRAWWLATGGIEFAFPTEEHGLNEWRPWRAATSSGPGFAAVTVSDHDDRSGLDVAVTVRLSADGHVAITPQVSNLTPTAQRFQFWINAMIPFSPDLRIELPPGDVEVHSTGDATLPGPGGRMTWPVYLGRDFSRASEWRQYLGVFVANPSVGRAAVVSPAGWRVTRESPIQIARGTKVFMLGDLPSSLYTDDDSRYLELWGGYTRTFGEYATLAAGQSVTWTEIWFADAP